MACVFRHLLKKWRSIADNSHELSLHASRLDTEQESLYQHNCGNTTLQEFCGAISDVTTIKYSWEDYMKDSSISDTFSSQEISSENSRQSSHNAEEVSQFAAEEASYLSSQEVSTEWDDTKPLWENTDFYSILQSFEQDEPIDDCLFGSIIVPSTLCSKHVSTLPSQYATLVRSARNSLQNDTATPYTFFFCPVHSSC